MAANWSQHVQSEKQGVVKGRIYLRKKQSRMALFINLNPDVLIGISFVLSGSPAKGLHNKDQFLSCSKYIGSGM
jgi:hypothetical protein